MKRFSIPKNLPPRLSVDQLRIRYGVSRAKAEKIYAWVRRDGYS